MHQLLGWCTLILHGCLEMGRPVLLFIVHRTKGIWPFYSLISHSFLGCSYPQSCVKRIDRSWYTDNGVWLNNFRGIFDLRAYVNIKVCNHAVEITYVYHLILRIFLIILFPDNSMLFIFRIYVFNLTILSDKCWEYRSIKLLYNQSRDIEACMRPLIYSQIHETSSSLSLTNS